MEQCVSMDRKFHPAIAAIESDDLEKFKALVAADPSLATSRSSRSHPNFSWNTAPIEPSKIQRSAQLQPAGPTTAVIPTFATY